MRRQAKQGKALGLDYTQNTREGKASRGVTYFLAIPGTGRHGWVLQSTHQSTPLHQHNTHHRTRQCSYNLLPDTPLQFLKIFCSFFLFKFPPYVAQEPFVPWTLAGPAAAFPLPVKHPEIQAKRLSGPNGSIFDKDLKLDVSSKSIHLLAHPSFPWGSSLNQTADSKQCHHQPQPGTCQSVKRVVS